MKKKTYAMRYIAGQPAKRIFPPEHEQPYHHNLTEEWILPDYSRLKVLVWNIFKQQRPDWQLLLENNSQDYHLVLLQEAQTTPALLRYATSNFASVDQVPAVALPQHSSGVMTLSQHAPIFCYPLREREPLLRSAKSALMTVYPTPKGQLLMVVNIHAVNFTIGIEVYRKQLAAIGEQMQHHQGPILLAGDFNAWSRQRSHALYSFIRQQSLKEVRFTDDKRRKAFGRPLDFIFYRDMQVCQSSVIETEASDHNPLLVEFQL